MSALNGIRIVELAESVAGEYRGKLLADFGAEVVKVERPGAGSPTRAMTPSSLFADLNTNEKSVALDGQTLDDIIAQAHGVIDDHTSAVELASRHPDVVFCSITRFGNDAPTDMRNAKSINVFHASGWVYHLEFETTGSSSR